MNKYSTGNGYHDFPARNAVQWANGIKYWLADEPAYNAMLLLEVADTPTETVH